MLTFYQFNLLPLDIKASYTFENGVYLDNREEDKFGFDLYSVDRFFVEVSYSKESNQVVQFKSFKSTAPLEPYLRQIKLVSLLRKS
jgi:hypothetical protein